MDSTILVALITGSCSIATLLLGKLMDKKSEMAKDVREIKNEVILLKNNNQMNGDMIYQILDHLATNNNSGQMKRALDEYNKHFRHS